MSDNIELSRFANLSFVPRGMMWLKSVDLAQRSAAVWRCSAFIMWTGWTLAMTLESWCQHHKQCPGIIIIIIIIIIIDYYSVPAECVLIESFQRINER